MRDQNYSLSVFYKPFHYNLLKKMAANMDIKGREWVVLSASQIDKTFFVKQWYDFLTHILIKIYIKRFVINTFRANI